ncbi:nucleolar protein 58 [Cinnamomum micranthum f. kanehirae]|uniref:Nucleolar protein 58 n=1 Tax=Cinnamomum micranthum f. kanehirae TaxID=337451 RepID=A0A3S3QHH1_9MAGN|nr:nucleolar protein 58 [Cinnamomum micranthum f. kanehirae]
MDLETENRIAALLMQEATKLRLQAEKDGVHVYLREPKVRGRPNSRFLTATVLGVQQANRAAEVNEMWRVRKKELELDDRLKGRLKDESRVRDDEYHSDSSEWRPRRDEADEYASGLSTSSKQSHEDYIKSEDRSLRDEEIEKFLHSRVKRGRGAIGSRMDEPGPYLPSSDSKGKLVANPDVRVVEEWERRVLGPEKPPFIKSCDPESNDMLAHDVKKKAKKEDSLSSKENSKHRLKKHKSRDKRRKEKKSTSKHHHGRSRS